MSYLRIQTTERETIFTHLDFRSKLILMGVVTIVAFTWEDPVYQIILAAIIISANLFAGVKRQYLLTFLVLMLPFYGILLLTHSFFNRELISTIVGTETLTPIFVFPENWWLVGGGYPTWEGLWYGINIVFKTLSFTLIIPLGVFTTDPNQMMVSLQKMKVPFKIIFIFSSTLRFLPLLIEEFNHIVEAQKLRGLAIERLGLLKRVRIYANVGVPLILGALVKSQQMEVVLQAKAFSGSSERTYLYDATLSKADVFLILLSGMFLITALILRFGYQLGVFSVPF
jgi:energy-coupling factor transport system permease protein